MAYLHPSSSLKLKTTGLLSSPEDIDFNDEEMRVGAFSVGDDEDEDSEDSVVVEKYGDVDHQAKKARVEGMRSVIDKNRVDAIVSQIAVMRQTEDLYVKRMGREKFEQQMVNLVNQMPGMEKVQAHQGDAHDDDSDGDVHG